MSAGQKKSLSCSIPHAEAARKVCGSAMLGYGGYDDHCPIATSNQAASPADIGDMALAQEQLTCRRRSVKESILNVSWK